LHDPQKNSWRYLPLFLVNAVRREAKFEGGCERIVEVT